MFKFFSTFVFATLIGSAAPSLFHVQVSGHGKPMILIPGLSSSGEVWNSTIDRYAKEYECHVLTLAGFAGQPAQANFSLAGVESDVSAYIAANKLGRPVVVGHSLGGSSRSASPHIIPIRSQRSSLSIRFPPWELPATPLPLQKI